MHTARRQFLVLLALTLAATSFPAVAQVVTATVPAAIEPLAEAVNPATNTTYVVNYCGDDPSCQSNGTVTVVNGATLSTQEVAVGVEPYSVAVNSVTNKIYVANLCGSDPTCQSNSTVTVIDGATLSTQTVNVGYSSGSQSPFGVAVNSVTNKIYEVDGCGSDPSCQSNGTVTVIDGVTLVTQTVNVGFFPYGAAVNSVSNKVYVANPCGNDSSCSSVGTATAIDGVTLNTQTVNLDYAPYDVGVNPTTNKIYVDNYCGTDANCASAGTVTVIDGNSLGTQDVIVGAAPYDVQVNAATNKTYATNNCGNDPSCSSLGTVTVIDGNNNYATTTVNVGAFPLQSAVNSATNKIYVANQCGNDLSCLSAATVTAIDGASNSTFPIAVGDFPAGVALNSLTNTIYTPNTGDGTVSVIGGATTLQFVAIPPCRLVDTRQANGEFGGPSLQGQQTRSFTIPDNSTCNIPVSAVAYSLNVTVSPQGPLRYLSVWPTPEQQPNVSTLNSTDGRVKANAAIVPAGVSGAISFYVTNTTDLILDIDGYFVPSNPSTLAFYPLAPCRVADTRNPDGPLGGPYLMAKTNRDFPVQDASACNIPSSAQAYSLNFTAVPHGFLGYLTVCPTPADPNQNCPVVSTLNSYGGQVTANAAIVPAGANGGEIRTYPSNDMDLIIDINGYFGAPGQGGLSLYPTVLCRVLDTRQSGGSGPFQFELEPPVDVLDSPCGVPPQSLAYVFNATVVPQGPLDYLALWPDGQSQPVVSTLNSYDGVISSNLAIVPSGNNGEVDAYANPVHKSDPTDITDLLLDISSFFAP